MSEKSPRVVVIAGPNGAGKSTSAQTLLRGPLDMRDFVNADAIARGLSAFDPESVALEAGRIMLGRLKQLAAARSSFAFETTLASRSFAPWLDGLRQSGYEFALVFLWLPNPEQAVARVADRVHHGGHHVPSETVRRRYSAGLRNFFSLYRPLATGWRFYDNSEPVRPRLVASGSGIIENAVNDDDVWSSIKRVYQK